MIRLIPAATLMLATLAVAPACAYDAPYYQQGWAAPAPTQVWYQQRPAPPPRWGWRAPPPARWAGPPPARWAPPPRAWGGPPPRHDRGWDGPRHTRHDARRPEHRRDHNRRDDRRW